MAGATLQIVNTAPAWYHPGRSGTLQMGPQNKIASFGEIHPKVLAEMDRFDLVLWVTGHAALPFLQDGVIADGAAFAQADRVFSGDLLTYAFWFN